MNKMITPSTPKEDEQEEEAYRLSFCDLPVSAAAPQPPSAAPDHLFEFSAAAVPHSYYNDIVFCGKIIHGDEDDDDDRLNEFQKRDYFATAKSQSLRKPSFHGAAENRRLSVSTRFAGEIARSKRSTGDMVYHAQRVNITALTSMSAKSRRRMFMFGPVKFKPEMELSAIKQRQAKLVPAAEKAPESGGGKSHWEVVKSSLRGRSHLVNVLARSLGCIPVGGGGGRGGFQRWVDVAN